MLAYLETLCIDANAANQLVNSSLAILFVRMLKNSRAPALRVRLASVLGLLVRHATYIADELGQSGGSRLNLLEIPILIHSLWSISIGACMALSCNP